MISMKAATANWTYNLLIVTLSF